ncbi:spore germination protein [Lysinibacillus composti]|uniref:Sporulation protein n=1 Tax=Lysinibacillus composti TaxID=720633 RepID=A0A3N9UDJ1_9BACI|nr:PepSY1/2 domain-containing protein [Lysinibacillus composti]MBM7609385.1 spore germination protein [Lysinibacillus composti]RQW74328.1 sporulation protein [Lysinibacillus composti]
MKNLVYLMAIAILALGLYSYDTKAENASLQKTLHAQYTNSLAGASEKLSNLQDSVSQSLLFQDEAALNNELDNIWRVSNELRSDISSLPLTREVSNDWIRYIGNIGEEAKLTAETGDYKSWQKKMSVVNSNLNALSDEWTVATSIYFDQDGDFSKWERVAGLEPDESPFKNISANLKNYSETDFPLTASESDYKKKIELKHIEDEEITKDQAIDVLEMLLPGIKDATYTVTQSKKDAAYPFYHIQFVKGSRVGYADITVKGGHILSFLSERPVQEKKGVTQEEIRKLAKQFLERAGYKDLEIVEERENHEAWHISLARVVDVGEEKAYVYPDGIQLKVSKDSGELLGLNAMEYIQKEQIKEQPVKPIDWKTFFRPGAVVEEERMAYTENDQFMLRLCYEVIVRMDNKSNDTFRIVVDTDTHEVVKVENLM